MRQLSMIMKHRAKHSVKHGALALTLIACSLVWVTTQAALVGRSRATL